MYVINYRKLFTSGVLVLICMSLITGNYSRLACEFYFVRNIGYYIIHIYVPSCLIVVLSWISFWLHREASPARVALGITTVLTMTTLISSSNASLPKISYLKSIDVFLVTCFVMVFASLLEYACVSYLGNRKWSPSQPRKVAAAATSAVAASSTTGSGNDCMVMCAAGESGDGCEQYGGCVGGRRMAPNGSAGVQRSVGDRRTLPGEQLPGVGWESSIFMFPSLRRHIDIIIATSHQNINITIVTSHQHINITIVTSH